MEDSVKTALALMSKAIDEPTSISRDSSSLIDQLDELIQPRVAPPRSYNDMVSLEKMLITLIHKSDENRIQDVQGRLETQRKLIVTNENDYSDEKNEEKETAIEGSKNSDGEADKKVLNQADSSSRLAIDIKGHLNEEEQNTDVPEIEPKELPVTQQNKGNPKKEDNTFFKEKTLEECDLQISTTNFTTGEVSTTTQKHVINDDDNTLKKKTLEEYDEKISRDAISPISKLAQKHVSPKSEYPRFYSDNKNQNIGKRKNMLGSLGTIVENSNQDLKKEVYEDGQLSSNKENNSKTINDEDDNENEIVEALTISKNLSKQKQHIEENIDNTEKSRTAENEMTTTEVAGTSQIQMSEGPHHDTNYIKKGVPDTLDVKLNVGNTNNQAVILHTEHTKSKCCCNIM